MAYRLKRTYVHADTIRTFDQLAEGESADEFRGRATCAMNIPEGAEYFVFEQTGHKYRGHVSQHCMGFKVIHHLYAPDEHLPGLFVLRLVGAKRLLPSRGSARDLNPSRGRKAPGRHEDRAALASRSSCRPCRIPPPLEALHGKLR